MPGLMVLMDNVNITKLRDVFNTFDVMQAQASKTADRDSILPQISGSIGTTQLNLQLKAALLGSIQYEADHTTATGMDLAVVVYKASQLLMAAIKNKDAEPLLRQVLELRTRIAGTDDLASIDSANNLANCIQVQGRYAEAEIIYRQVMEKYTHTIGAEHPNAINGACNLAMCIDSQGRYAEAEPLLRMALKAATRVRGPDNPYTINIFYTLASCILNQVISLS